MLPANIPQCQHIRLNGLRCGSPALRGQRHCYYHSTLRVIEKTPAELALVEDASSVQVALMQVLRGLARQQWDSRRAGLILYALQIASQNVKQIREERALASRVADARFSREVICELPSEPAAKSQTKRSKRSATEPPTSLIPQSVDDLAQKIPAAGSQSAIASAVLSALVNGSGGLKTGS